MTIEIALQRLMTMDSDNSGGQSGPENQFNGENNCLMNERVS